jgi:putative Mg2+ transporter-C (MgtC) family protein
MLAASPPLDWSDLALRLALALAAGALLGIDRTTRGRPAGLRTTMMVCVAAAIAMLLADVISHPDSTLAEPGMRLDPLRMAQGILAGMGFIGAGAIVRRGDMVHGITTAATLWFATVVGLCAGAGQWTVAVAGLAFGLAVLWPVNLIEERVRRERTATLRVSASPDALTEAQLRLLVEHAGYITASWTIHFDRAENTTSLQCHVRWKARPSNDAVPSFVHELSSTPGVREVKWEPVLS